MRIQEHSFLHCSVPLVADNPYADDDGLCALLGGCEPADRVRDHAGSV